jgi:hypothetical protein
MSECPMSFLTVGRSTPCITRWLAKVWLQVPGPPYPITDTGKYLVIWEIQADESLRIKLEMWNNDELPKY